MTNQDVLFIARFKPTSFQRKWVDEEVKRTGESQATVMRRLIQEKIDNGCK